MGTRIYGYSDDTVVIQGAGNTFDDVECFQMDVILTFDDGSIVRCMYGKQDKAIWSIDFVSYGSAHYVRNVCDDENAPIYSDELWINAYVTDVKKVRRK